MNFTVRYIGTVDPFFETLITGQSVKWGRGDTDARSEADAELLVASGLFEQAFDGSAVVPILAATFAAPTAAMLADTRTFYELQTTKALYRSNGVSLEVVGSQNAAAPAITRYRYTAAGSYLVATGTMRLLGVFGETTVAGSITIKDSLEGTLGPTVFTQTTVSASNVMFDAGSAPTFQPIYSGVFLTLSGNSTIDVLVAPLEM